MKISSQPTSPLDTAVVQTPVGALAVIADGGVVVAAGFAPVPDMADRLAADLRARGLRSRRDLGSITDAVCDYLAGDLAALDDVPVRQPGGEFTQEVWRVMREIPAGQPWTYAELATKAGRPAAVRAVGNACARNLVAPFVPCHRVLRTGGGLGGYYYGLPVKQWLLDHELEAGS
jgi:methylated-DNA-[protein]-cysteine S-methyltransferase